MPAAALSCSSAPEEALYNRVKTVFIARIVSQELIGTRNPDDRDDRRKVSYGIKVLEELKGSVDYDSFVSSFAWSTDRARLAMGETNIFFMGDTPGFGDCSRRYSLEHPGTQSLLKRLREVRDGLVDTFEGSWSTFEGENACNLFATYPVIDRHHTLTVTFAHRKDSDKNPLEFVLRANIHPRIGSLKRRNVSLLLNAASVQTEFENHSLEFADRSDFMTLLDSPEALLNSIVHGHSVSIGSADFNLKVPVRLNGGLPYFEEFARCSGLTLQVDEP